MSILVAHGGKSTTQFVQLLDSELRGVDFEVLQDVPEPEGVAEGDLLLALGRESVDDLRARGVLHKKWKLSTLRELIYPYGAGQGLVSYSPNVIYSDEDKEPLIRWDFRLARRLYETGSPYPDLSDRDYRYVENFNAVLQYINTQYKDSGRPVPVAFDLETIGLDPFRQPDDEHPGAKIVSVAFTYKPGQADVWYCLGDDNPEVWEEVRVLCTSDKVKLVGANLKYDDVWLRVHTGIEITNQSFDTFLVGSLLNENLGNSLNLHAKIFTPIGAYDDEFNQKYEKGRMDLVPKDDLLTYAGGDTDACYQVRVAQIPRLMRNKKLANFYHKLLQPAATAFAAMEQRGVCVDVDRYKELRKEVAAEMDDISERALRMVPATIKHTLTPKQKKVTNPTLLRKFFFSPWGMNLKPKMETEKEKLPSTALEHLEMFLDNEDAAPYINLLDEYGSAAKTVQTYIDGFLKHLRSDNRFHPSYYLGHAEGSGTVTGRLSAKEPAYQVVPKHTRWAKPLRSAFVPPPGHVVLKADYSQGELRVTACVANEPNMIAAYKQGIDLHLKTGAAVSQILLEDALKLPKEQMAKVRQGGKAGNFGLCIAEGQLVLTDTGLIPIERVTCYNKVWDGLNWVEHDGLVYRGRRGVITWDGLTATDDHEVWVEDGRKIPLWRAASEGATLVRSGRGAEPVDVRYFDIGPNQCETRGKLSKSGWVLRCLRAGKDVLRRQLIDRQDAQVRLSEKLEVRGGHTSSYSGEAVRCDDAAVLPRYTRIQPSLQGPRHLSVIRLARRFYSMGLSALAGLGLQEAGLRSNRQRWALQQRQLKARDEVRQSKESVRVYDLLNAGPNRRFTCSGVLVSNCYGMQPPGFVNYARRSYGVNLTLQEAEEFHETFFATYPRLTDWHKEYKDLAHKYGLVVSPLGRVRHLPAIHSKNESMRSKAERQAINSPIQSTLSDMGLLALAILYEQYPELWAFGDTHDELSFYVPVNDIEVWGLRIREVMENLPFDRFGWNPVLDFPVDLEWSADSLGACEPLVLP